MTKDKFGRSLGVMRIRAGITLGLEFVGDPRTDNLVSGV